MWKLTVRLLMLTICAISGEVLPRADQVRHSISRSFSATWRDHTSLRARLAEARIDDGGEDLEIDGLGDVVVRAEAAALELAVAVGARGEKHEWHRLDARGERGQALHHLEAGHARHVDVAQHEVGIGLENRRQARCARRARSLTI